MTFDCRATMDIAIRPDDDERHTIVLDSKDVGTITPGVDETSTPWIIERFHSPTGAKRKTRCSSLEGAAAALSTDEMKEWILGERENLPDVPPQPRQYQTARTVATTATGTVAARSMTEAARLALLGQDTDWKLEHDVDISENGRGYDVVVFDPDSGEEIVARRLAETERINLATCARCGADLTIFDEFTTNVPTPDGDDTHVHADESRCGRQTVRRTLRICGYLPSSREVEFTDRRTGKVGYGVITPALAAVLKSNDILGKTVIATGTMKTIAWSWPLNGHDSGLEIENLLPHAEDREDT